MRTSAVNYLIAYCCLHCTDRPGFAHTITHFQRTSALSREQTLQPSSSPLPPLACSPLLTKPFPPPPHTSFLTRSYSCGCSFSSASPCELSFLLLTLFLFEFSRLCIHIQPGETCFLSLFLSTSLSMSSYKDIATMVVVDEGHPTLFFAINLRLFLPSLSLSTLRCFLILSRTFPVDLILLLCSVSTLICLKAKDVSRKIRH